MQVTQSARVQVFWQPGCSSCLRTKEFLTKQGIDFESIDVLNDPTGMEKLHALGARSVPVVALGGRFTFCQSFNDVIKFLDLKTKLMDPLPPEQLIAKLDTVIQVAQRLIKQFSTEQLRENFRDRNRNPADTAFHIFRVAQMGVDERRLHALRRSAHAATLAVDQPVHALSGRALQFLFGKTVLETSWQIHPSWSSPSDRRTTP